MALTLADDAIDAICMHVHAMDVGRVRLVSKAWRVGMARIASLVPLTDRLRMLAVVEHRRVTSTDALQVAWQAVSTAAVELLVMLEAAARATDDGPFDNIQLCFDDDGAARMLGLENAFMHRQVLADGRHTAVEVVLGNGRQYVLHAGVIVDGFALSTVRAIRSLLVVEAERWTQTMPAAGFYYHGESAEDDRLAVYAPVW